MKHKNNINIETHNLFLEESMNGPLPSTKQKLDQYFST